MSNTTGQQQLSLAEGLQPFRGQGWKMQVAVVAGGLLVWTAVYAALLTLLGSEGVATADSAAAIRLRRNAAAVAGAVLGLYFAALWTRAYGGPFLNILYLIVTQTFMPDRVYALGGTPPEHTITTAGTAFGFFSANTHWVWTHAIAAGPSLVVFGLVLAHWMRSLSDEEEKAFATNHLPKSWLRLRQTE